MLDSTWHADGEPRHPGVMTMSYRVWYTWPLPRSRQSVMVHKDAQQEANWMVVRNMWSALCFSARTVELQASTLKHRASLIAL